MKQLIEDLLKKTIENLKKENFLSQEITPDFKIERTKEKSHGDFSTNIALTLAKPCKTSPQKIAQEILNCIPENNIVEKIEIAGPGFINFFMCLDARLGIIQEVFDKGENYGASNYGNGEKILVEYLSANPTGPLHVGHGRIAAFGATLSNVLKFAGFNVVQEYYVNDAGRQMNILAVSVFVRYLELMGEKIIFPMNAYKGDYVYNIAQSIIDNEKKQYIFSWEEIHAGLPKDAAEGGDKEEYIDALIDKSKKVLGEENFKKFHKYAVDFVLNDIKDDLEDFKVCHDSWFSEQSLFDDGSIEKSINAMKNSGYTFEKEGALWFQSSAFGDEKDRVLIRANGQPTYFASDIAYHWNKYDRGFTRVINAMGADHHGYFPRLKAAMQALNYNEAALIVLFVQFAILYRGKERVQMSTRSGSFVTLRELREEVGNDAARFFYALRKAEQHMDFDLDLAKSRSNENPVYYIQYAHARICSVLRQLEERELLWDKSIGLLNLCLLKEPQEMELIDLISAFPEIVEAAARTYEPHQIAYYLKELATALHSYYNAIILLCEDNTLRFARLCLIEAVGNVLKNGLNLLGVSAPRSM